MTFNPHESRKLSSSNEIKELSDFLQDHFSIAYYLPNQNIKALFKTAVIVRIIMKSTAEN